MIDAFVVKKGEFMVMVMLFRNCQLKLTQPRLLTSLI